MKTIAAPALSTASITSSSRFEPPGWMIAVTPASSASCGPSANGKNASEASEAPVERVAVLARLLDRDPDRVDAAHLPRADPDRLQVLREHDRVRGDVLADPPGEEQVAPLRLVGSPHRDLHPLAVVDLPVAVLHEQAAEHALEVELRSLDRAPLDVVQDPRSPACGRAPRPPTSS